MAILGVLLGITMTVLAYVVWYGKRELDFAYEANTDTRDRLKRLEDEVDRLSRRIHKPVPTTNAAVGEAAPRLRAGRVSVRTWNEDIGAAE